MTTTNSGLHWLTRYDPDDGEPYGEVCSCSIGEDHDGSAEPEEESEESPEFESPETIAAYEDGGKAYEIDHLGLLRDSQWGEFQVYCDGESTAYFAIEESALKLEFRPAELPVTTDELIALAKRAVGGDAPDPLPAELSEAIAAILRGPDAEAGQ
jgi:hypothetical protein